MFNGELEVKNRVGSEESIDLSLNTIFVSMQQKIGIH